MGKALSRPPTGTSIHGLSRVEKSTGGRCIDCVQRTTSLGGGMSLCGKQGCQDVGWDVAVALRAKRRWRKVRRSWPRVRSPSRAKPQGSKWRLGSSLRLWLETERGIHQHGHANEPTLHLECRWAATVRDLHNNRLSLASESTLIE